MDYYQQRVRQILKRWVQRVANSRHARPLWLFVFWFVNRTTRVDVRNQQQMAVLRGKGIRVIYVCRHWNILATLGHMAYRLHPHPTKVRPESRPMILTDGGPEGQIVDLIMRPRGYPVATTHDHPTALVDLRAAMRRGHDAAMTLDQRKNGADGQPVARDQAGCATLAFFTGAKIVPVAVGCRKRQVLSNTWDRLEIPMPGFFRVLRFGTPIDPPTANDPRTLIRKTQEVGRALDDLRARVEVEIEVDRRKARRLRLVLTHAVLFAIALLLASANASPWLTGAAVLLGIWCALMLAAYTAGFSTKVMTSSEATVGEAAGALARIVSKVSDEAGRDGEHTVKILCGRLDSIVYQDAGLLDALDDAIQAQATPQFVLTVPPAELPHRLREWINSQQVLVFVHHADVSTPHFVVVNQMHVRLEWTHEAGHYELTQGTPREAEAHFYAICLGQIYDRLFDALRDHKDTVRYRLAPEAA
ncbi:MAG TPA: hypothetical protein VM537_07975 [Anaerolineae bacterium]|nr:hypothetical protein [Anaerolineae bacterium]